MDNIYILQYKLFNDITSNDDMVYTYINQHKIMAYTSKNNIIEYDKGRTYNINDIIWIYDENNYRIPYIGGIRIDYISLQSNDNIYDYISSNSIIPDEEIISGEKLQSLCDLCISNNDCNPNFLKYSKKYKSIDDIDNLQDYKSIYVKTDNLLEFYSKYTSQLNNHIILSHNSDIEIDHKYINYINQSNICTQLSQNVIIPHPKLISIPIGIENSRWFDHQIFHKVRKMKDIKKEKNVYFYFSLDTHFSRCECYHDLKDKFTWNEKRSKEEYFIELKKHKYAICPRGNGIDTHRIWECLYLDVIPIIVEPDFINIHHLPMIILKSWKNMHDIPNQFNHIYNSKITLSYYNNIINMI